MEISKAVEEVRAELARSGDDKGNALVGHVILRRAVVEELLNRIVQEARLTCVSMTQQVGKEFLKRAIARLGELTLLPTSPTTYTLKTPNGAGAAAIGTFGNSHVPTIVVGPFPPNLSRQKSWGPSPDGAWDVGAAVDYFCRLHDEAELIKPVKRKEGPK